jgi:hypothetical protein
MVYQGKDTVAKGLAVYQNFTSAFIPSSLSIPAPLRLGFSSIGPISSRGGETQ